jgi:hypothetical protein
MRVGEGFRVRLSWRVIAAAICFCVCLTAGEKVSLAQDSQPRDGRYYESQARKAYQEKDYSSFLENMKAAEALRPNHPRLMYNLAAAYALNGQQKEALLWLGKVAEMGLIYPAQRDSDFDSIKDGDGFKAILKRFETNKAPIINSATAFTLHEKGFIPESVSYDPATEVFYLSSVYRRKIVSLDRKGVVKDFSAESDGLWSVMGMKVDAARSLLWVCTTAHPQMSNYTEEDNGKSALFKYDLRSGKLIKKYLLPNKPKPHWLGDLVVNSQGDVFATDSVSPAIYVVNRKRDELELFLEDESFASLQGLDFTPDGRQLFVADYAKGIFVIDMETKRHALLSPAPNSTLLGIDGLYSYKGSLLAIQNGVNPSRLIRLSLSGDLKRVERLEILEVNNSLFDEPTLGVLVRDTFYFIANSQWGAIDSKGQLAAPDKLKEPVVLKIKLNGKNKASRVSN